MANTLDALPNVLHDSFITTLNNKLAALDLFTSNFSDGPFDPLRPTDIAVVTAAGAAVENPTNFVRHETTETLTTVTPVHISQGFGLSSAELNLGYQLEKQIEKNAQVFSNAIWDKVMALITNANYGITATVVAPAAFVVADLQALWERAADQDPKNCMLAPGYFSKLLPTNRESYQGQDAAGSFDGMFGFDKLAYSNRWAAASNSIEGISVSPDAIAIVGRIPVNPAAGSYISSMTTTLDTLGLSVQSNVWASEDTRTLNASFDVAFGAAVGDPTALQALAIA